MDTTSQFNRRFGARIKYLRESHEPYLSQEKSAFLADYAVSSWSRLERGVQACHPQKLPIIARTLGVDINSLFDFGEDDDEHS